MTVIVDRIDLLCEILQDFCTKHDLPLMSADDLLYSNELSEGKTLTEDQKCWLRAYISTWDTVMEEDNQQSYVNSLITTGV